MHDATKQLNALAGDHKESPLGEHEIALRGSRSADQSGRIKCEERPVACIIQVTKALKELKTLSVQVQLDLLMLQIILHQAHTNSNKHSKCRRKGIDKINPISLWNRHVRDSSSRRKGGGNVRIVTTLHGKLFRR